jgi:hypothetical protein
MGTILMRIWPIEVYKNIKVFGNKGLLIGEKKRKREKKGSYMYIYRVLRSLCNLGWNITEG